MDVIDATIDVEAKAKELAVLKLQEELSLPPWRGDAALSKHDCAAGV